MEIVKKSWIYDSDDHKTSNLSHYTILIFW